MSLPGHGASRSVQLHAIPSERGEMEAFLLEAEKFLVADTSRSSEKPHDYVKPGCRKAGCGWAWASSPGAGPTSVQKFPEIQRISKRCLCAAVKEGGREDLQRGRVI